MRLRCLLFLVLTVLFLPDRAVADPYGPSTHVNAPSVTYKAPVGIATNVAGESIVAWSDRATAGNPSVVLERYDALGRPFGTDDQAVGTLVYDVALDDAGNFALLRLAAGAWTVSLYQRSGQFLRDVRVPDVGARMPAGNTVPAGLAMNGRGQFVVTWHAETATGTALVARTFAPNGSFMTGTTVVSEGRPAFEPDVAIDAAGNYVVTWDRFRSLTDRTSEVWAKRFSILGAPLSDAIPVSTDRAADASRGRIAMAPSGAFVVAWVGRGGEQPPGSASQTTIARRFSSSALPLGAPFRVDASMSLWPTVAMASNGSFVIAWGRGQGAAVARTYDPNGVPLGSPFSLGEMPGVGFFPRVGMDAGGNVTALWGQLVSPGTSDQSEIYLRQFSPYISPSLQNGVAITQLWGPIESWRFYKITVPAGRSSVEFSISGGAGATGDADLYVRWGSLPTLEDWDGAPFLQGNDETARMLNFPPGDWYVGIHGYEAYSGLSVRAAY